MVIDTGTRARRPPRGVRACLFRSLTAGVGICSILWAFSSLAAYHAEAPLKGVAQDILSGKSFNAAKLNELKMKLDSTPEDQLRSVAVDAALIRLRLLELKLAKGAVPDGSPDIAAANTTLVTALSNDPSNSFLWFAGFWLNRLRGDAVDLGSKFLRMSYETGPNEAWIAQRRNPVALNNWISLPGDLLEQARSEFVRLVQSQLYADAANIVAGPGWPIHQQLLGRLAPLSEADRYAMAGALAAKNLDGVKVPGVNEHPSRPF